MTLPRTHKAGHDARQAFEAEAMPHMPSLLNTALYMTRNRAAAEDLVQETMLKAYRFWHRYEQGTNCKAWLFRILTNTFINGNRRKRYLHQPLDTPGHEVSGDRLQAPTLFYSGPEEDYLGKLLPEHVKAAIEALPENFRLPVVLADLHDFSYKEIAEIMECPVGTIMSRLYRGRKRLQEDLFEYAVELGIISPQSAKGADGTISLDNYRQQRKISGTN